MLAGDITETSFAVRLLSQKPKEPKKPEPIVWVCIANNNIRAWTTSRARMESLVADGLNMIPLIPDCPQPSVHESTNESQ
jgi:hypothetical protein